MEQCLLNLLFYGINSDNYRAGFRKFSKGGFHMENGFDMKKWKNDTINHYKAYLKTIDASSIDYELFRKGIEDLEKTLV